MAVQPHTTRRAVFAGAILLPTAVMLSASTDYDALAAEASALISARQTDTIDEDREAAFFSAVEGLPCTAETARLKARAVQVIYAGDLDEMLAECSTLDQRLAVHALKALVGAH